MSTTRARARCPGLSILAQDPVAEESAMGWLIAAGFGISPRVERTEVGLVTVDLRGVPDVEGAVQRVVDESRREGLPVCAGLSNTPERSRLASFLGGGMRLAVADEELFAGVSPAAIPLPAEIRRCLAEWGLRDVLAFARISKEDLGRRLSPEAVAFWEEMTGRKSRVLRVIAEAPVFRSSMDLEHRVETLEQALFVIHRLLKEVCGSLVVAGRVARSLELSWRTDSGASGGHVFTLPEATARLEPLFAMVEGHLSGVRTDEALKWIALRAIPGEPLARQGDFFEVSAASPFSFQETIGRIHGLLGEGRVGFPVFRDSHHPEAFRLEAPAAQFRAEEEAAGYGSSAMGPALRRLRPPRRVEVVCREGRPAYCRWKQFSPRIRSVRGPWRISGNWWDPELRWSREEWDVEWGPDYFCRLVRHPGEEWFWEGIYD